MDLLKAVIANVSLSNNGFAVHVDVYISAFERCQYITVGDDIVYIDDILV